MSIGQWWLAGGNRINLEQNLFQCYFVHPESHIKSPKITPASKHLNHGMTQRLLYIGQIIFQLIRH
jgi:hypothetical protein